ncbi:MAG: hypothetical protein WCG23_09965 [bacterium]
MASSDLQVQSNQTPFGWLACSHRAKAPEVRNNAVNNPLFPIKLANNYQESRTNIFT